MKKLRLLSILVVLLCSVRSGKGADDSSFWEVKDLTPRTQITYQFQTGIISAINGVLVKSGDVELTANRAQLNEATGEVVAEGAVALKRAGQLWMGDHLEYNFKTKQMKAGDFKTGATPIFASGQGLASDPSSGTYTATNAVITTDDDASPRFKVKARYLKLTPGKSLEARDAVVYDGPVPIMYFPIYRRSLERHPNNFVITPGYRSLYGPYLLGAYNWYLSDQLSGAFNLDYRQKRGWGGGPDVRYDLGRWGQGSVKTYYTQDQEPGTDPRDKPIDRERYRIHFSHQANLRTNLTARIVAREQSDAFVIRDFFENEYQKDPQPRSFLEVNQLWSNFSLNALAQPQVNDFFTTLERLPDIKLSAIRQQLGVSPFYYEGETSAGYFRYQFADPKRNEFEAFRGDSFHQLLLPHTYFGWLNVTPRVGGRFTYYSEAHGRGATTREQDRWIFNTGVEVATKFSRAWEGAHSRFWEVNGLRHIIEPSLNYVFVPSPSVSPLELPQFDTEMPSFRLLPIDFPDYNAIDSVDSENVVRLSLRNKLQTKRRDTIENLVNWAFYTDWRIKPRANQSTFADFYSDLDLRPRTWLTLTSETRFDIEESQWKEANHYATFQPNSMWSYALGHRYLRHDPALGADYGNNLITSRFYYRLNENYAVRMSHRFEARDGTLEEQYYTLYRDLRSWTAALTFRVRENHQGASDFTVAVTFSLKAFPRFRSGDDRESPSLLLGS